jgi:hypothetical protein
MQNKIIARFYIVFFAFISLFFTNPAKSQSSNLNGYYASKFHTSGYLENYVKIELHPDCTFNFYWCRYSGNYRALGTYKVINDTVLLTYQPSKNDTIYNDRNWEYYTRGTDTLRYDESTNRYVAKQDIKHPVAPVSILDTSGAILHKVHIHNYTLSSCIKERPVKYYYRNMKLLDVDNRGKIIYPKYLDLSRHRMFLLFGPHYWRLRRCCLIKGKDNDKIVGE